MSTDEIQVLEEEFQEWLNLIGDQIGPELQKSERIRLNAWIKKLCSVVDNVFWIKNRNFYAHVLACMLINGNLTYPFNKAPPQSSLPKLSPYDLSYSVRQQLSQHKNKNSQQNKENMHCFANCPTNSSSFIEKNNSMVSCESYEEKNKMKKLNSTLRKKNKHKTKAEPMYFTTIKESLTFLACNYKTFHNNPLYKGIIEDIIDFGDQMGEDLRQMKISMIQ